MLQVLAILACFAAYAPHAHQLLYCCMRVFVETCKSINSLESAMLSTPWTNIGECPQKLTKPTWSISSRAPHTKVKVKHGKADGPSIIRCLKNHCQAFAKKRRNRVGGIVEVVKQSLKKPNAESQSKTCQTRKGVLDGVQYYCGLGLLLPLLLPLLSLDSSS
jgi:hypothetical protein